MWPIAEYLGQTKVTNYLNDVSKYSVGNLNRVAKGSLIF